MWRRRTGFGNFDTTKGSHIKRSQCQNLTLEGETTALARKVGNETPSAATSQFGMARTSAVPPLVELKTRMINDFSSSLALLK
jgi:hypothetical protein